MGWYLITRNFVLLAGAFLLFAIEPRPQPVAGRATSESAEEATPVS